MFDCLQFTGEHFVSYQQLCTFYKLQEIAMRIIEDRTVSNKLFSAYLYHYPRPMSLSFRPVIHFLAFHLFSSAASFNGLEILFHLFRHSVRILGVKICLYTHAGQRGTVPESAQTFICETV
jgi:hypothetical protein